MRIPVKINGDGGYFQFAPAATLSDGRVLVPIEYERNNTINYYLAYASDVTQDPPPRPPTPELDKFNADERVKVLRDYYAFRSFSPDYYDETNFARFAGCDVDKINVELTALAKWEQATKEAEAKP